jgi:hypothetical protein
VGTRLDDFGGFWICKFGDIMIVLIIGMFA